MIDAFLDFLNEAPTGLVVAVFVLSTLALFVLLAFVVGLLERMTWRLAVRRERRRQEAACRSARIGGRESDDLYGDQGGRPRVP